MKTIIERGASWTLDETRLLLSLWGQDLIQRQATCQKRTKEVYEKISEKFNQSGYERTPDQVRTRVFNMIAEYRRILRDPSPERMRKCIFFDALHRIYQAKHMDDVQSALDDYEPESPPYIRAGRGDEVSDGDTMDETLANNTTTEAASNSAASNSKKSNANATTSEPANDSINTRNDTSNAASGGNKQAAAPEKEATATNQAAKKMKLESPKPGSSQAAMEAVEAAPLSKQKGSSATSASSAATTNNTSNAASSAASNNVAGGARHQSLLLPQTPSVSTPISNKLPASSGGNSTPAYINVSSSLKNVMGATRLVGHPNGSEPINLNGTPTANRLPTTAAITSHQFYQAPVNTFDVTSSALLIDRMFAHLSRESENMREWIALEKDRIALERARRAQETERDTRRERVLIDTLMRFQEQWISFITKITPGLVEKHADQIPTLNIPPREGFHEAEPQMVTPKVASQSSQASVGLNASTTSSSTTATTSLTSPSTNTSSTSAGDIL